jgi:HTH-type transcriptional regulator, competence development regulator
MYVYQVVHSIFMNNIFGSYIREKREALKENNKDFSLRQVAIRIGVEPSYLSKIERGLPAPLSEEKIMALSKDLGVNPDILLALAGKVSSDVQMIIRKRPELFAELIRQLKDMPDNAVLSLVREVRDGNW